MDRNKYFDFNRLFHFVQRQAVLNMNTMLVAAGAIFGILLVISLAVAYFNPTDIGNLRVLYLVVFFLSGFMFTSRIFEELHSPQRSYAYLTLPVSTTEKVTGSWILSGPLYLIFYWIITMIIYMITSMVAGVTYPNYNPFGWQFFGTVASYMAIQPVFFLGAVYFRKNNFLKTLLSLFVLIVVIGLYSGLLVWLLFGGSINGQDFPQGEMTGLGNGIAQLLEVFFTYILGPFMLIVSYFRLKERQV